MTLTKAEALQRTQVSFIQGEFGAMGITLGEKRCPWDELKPRTTEPEQKLYQTDPNALYAHPYYWAAVRAYWELVVAKA